jgi:catechol 2,3-dioxygenase-like lactoylglutathione lyase family enzyme
MAQLNHLIVHCRSKEESATFLTEILGLPAAKRFGPFLAVELDNGVTLDFDTTDDEITSGHYAFLISEAEFDDALTRIRGRGLTFWADPSQSRPNEIHRRSNGRGCYFEDPNGHLLEILTRPYASV